MFLVNNFAILNGVRFVGSGRGVTFIKQGAAGNPAFYITVPGGTNYARVELSGFTALGATSPTAPFCSLTANTGSGAIWQSRFDFNCQNVYQGLVCTSSGVNEIFDNYFNVTVEGAIASGVTVTNGIYNTFVLNLENVTGPALVHSGVYDVVDVVANGQIQISGLDSTFTRCTVEDIWGSALSAGSSAIQISGTGATLINPSVQFESLASSNKATYAFQPGANCTLINPFILNGGTAALANPIAPPLSNYTWTLIGGQSNCANKMETVYNEAGNSNILSLRYVTMIGDVSQLTAQGRPAGSLVRQYFAPVAGGNAVTLNGNTDILIIDSANTVTALQVNILTGLVDGRRITITTTTNIPSSINWVSTATTTQLPTSLAAGARVTFVYDATHNKFYLA